MPLENFCKTNIVKTDLLEIRSGLGNSEGNQFVTAFVKYPGQKSSGVTTFTLFPRSIQIGGGHMFELSSQIGCVVGCSFCGVPKFERSLMPLEIMEQVVILVQEARKRNIELVEPFKYNFCDGDDLLLNKNCLKAIELLVGCMEVNVKVSSVLVKSKLVKRNINDLLNFGKTFSKTLHLQVSLSSTNQKIRQKLSRVQLMSMFEIAEFGARWQSIMGRKITLSFTLTSDSRCDVNEIVNVLPPELFRVRLHPYKPNGIFGMQSIKKEHLISLAESFSLAGYDLVSSQLDPLERKNALLLSGTQTFQQ